MCWQLQLSTSTAASRQDGSSKSAAAVTQLHLQLSKMVSAVTLASDESDVNITHDSASGGWGMHSHVFAYIRGGGVWIDAS